MSIRGYVIVARVASAKGKGKEGRGLGGWVGDNRKTEGDWGGGKGRERLQPEPA